MKNRAMKCYLRCSGETVSRYFNRVMYAIISMHDDFIKQPGRETPREIWENLRFWPYFKDCVGSVDGTHIPFKKRFAIIREEPMFSWTTQADVVVACRIIHNHIRRVMPNDLLLDDVERELEAQVQIPTAEPVGENLSRTQDENAHDNRQFIYAETYDFTVGPVNGNIASFAAAFPIRSYDGLKIQGGCSSLLLARQHHNGNATKPEHKCTVFWFCGVGCCLAHILEIGVRGAFGEWTRAADAFRANSGGSK
ncbi:hypothetical protein L1049_002557 [Liquidambar formosana]|uniref:Uncharacterized protein n=1 Tax=Liquidambar formosana TaxID=63359 RepID=A0AAP0NHC0_LIQFO